MADVALVPQASRKVRAYALKAQHAVANLWLAICQPVSCGAQDCTDRH